MKENDNINIPLSNCLHKEHQINKVNIIGIIAIILIESIIYCNYISTGVLNQKEKLQQINTEIELNLMLQIRVYMGLYDYLNEINPDSANIINEQISDNSLLNNKYSLKESLDYFIQNTNDKILNDTIVCEHISAISNLVEQNDKLYIEYEKQNKLYSQKQNNHIYKVISCLKHRLFVFFVL